MLEAAKTMERVTAGWEGETRGGEPEKVKEREKGGRKREKGKGGRKRDKAGERGNQRDKVG